MLVPRRLFSRCYHFRMSRAGFVLVGGSSSRMGRDKALLPYGGRTLVEHVATQVQAAAGSVFLVGPPERYAALGYPVVADRFPGLGPAAGIHAALAAQRADWNLIVACDMPGLTPPLLESLFQRAEQAGGHGAAAVAPDGSMQPLCAVYHRCCLPWFERALREGRLKLRDLIASLALTPAPVRDPAALANWNTPADVAEHPMP